jgi:hypothetical protein
MDINQQFLSILGRAPSQAETDYYQKFLSEGGIQPYEIGQILQATPEFQQARLEKDTTAYGQKLQAGDDQIMQRGADMAGAQAQSRFAGLGRPNSSALAASVFGQQGQLASSLAQSRQSALADFYGQGLKQNMALYQQGGQNGLERAYGLRDESRQYGQQMELANRGQAYYSSMLDKANRQSRNQGMAAFGGSLLGAGIGAFGGSFAGPGGTMLGAQLGAGVGGKAGGLF